MAFNVRLVLSIGVMYACFLFFFWQQEALIPKKDPTQLSFPYHSIILLTESLFAMLGAGVVILVKRTKLPKNPLPYLTIAIPQQLSVLLANKANKYLDYLTVSLLKTAKPISVMFCSVLFFKQHVSKERVIVVCLLTVGLLVFSLKGTPQKGSAPGYLLAIGALISDAIYVPNVDRLKKAGGGPYATLLLASFWRTIIVLLLGIRELGPAFAFLNEHPEFYWKLLTFGVSGAVAQIALYYALSLSNGLVISIATNTRKFFTIVLSSIFYKHPLSGQQWFGIAIVFAALSIEMFGKKKKSDPKTK